MVDIVGEGSFVAHILADHLEQYLGAAGDMHWVALMYPYNQQEERFRVLWFAVAVDFGDAPGELEQRRSWP